MEVRRLRTADVALVATIDRTEHVDVEYRVVDGEPQPVPAWDDGRVAEAHDDCIACVLTSGKLPPPGGRIHRTPHWIVEHCVGALGVGALIVKPERHVVHVADLNDDEAAELGPLLRDAARVTTALTNPEQVYISLWSHAAGQPGHIHYVVHPITRAVMDEFGHGPDVQPAMFAQDRPLDLPAVEAFADEARRLFSAG